MIDLARFGLQQCLITEASATEPHPHLWTAQKITFVAIEILIVAGALTAFFLGSHFAIPIALGGVIVLYEGGSTLYALGLLAYKLIKKYNTGTGNSEGNTGTGNSEGNTGTGNSEGNTGTGNSEGNDASDTSANKEQNPEIILVHNNTSESNATIPPMIGPLNQPIASSSSHFTNNAYIEENQGKIVADNSDPTSFSNSSFHANQHGSPDAQPNDVSSALSVNNTEDTQEAKPPPLPPRTYSDDFLKTLHTDPNNLTFAIFASDGQPIKLPPLAKKRFWKLQQNKTTTTTTTTTQQTQPKIAHQDPMPTAQTAPGRQPYSDEFLKTLEMTLKDSNFQLLTPEGMPVTLTDEEKIRFGKLQPDKTTTTTTTTTTTQQTQQAQSEWVNIFKKGKFLTTNASSAAKTWSVITTSQASSENFLKMDRRAKDVPCHTFRKNQDRYTNVLTYKYNAVQLKSGFYVNASKMPDGTIITQGPLETTVADFWQMVWEQEREVIVMVTDLQEHTGNKCFKYWHSLNKTLTVNGLEITYTKEKPITQKTKTIKRTFKVTDRASRKSREVIQVHHRGWADSQGNYTEFMQSLDEVAQKKALIHCSAGIGRSGVYYAALMLKKVAQKSNPRIPIEVDLMKYIGFLRQYRMGLVQTWAQYQLLETFINNTKVQQLDQND